MKKGYIALIFVAVLLSGVLATNAAESITVRKEKIDPANKKVTILVGPAVAIPGATTLYIIERKRVLQSEIERDPNAVIEATVSLNALYSPSDVDNILKGFQVETKEAHFQSKTSDHGGEFKIEGTLSDSVLKLREKVKERIVLSQEQLKNSKDPVEKEGLKSAIQIEQQLFDEINQGEIGVYGVDVKGSAKELKRLANHEKVRLVDPKISENAAEYESQGYKTRVVVFPVPPVFR